MFRILVLAGMALGLALFPVSALPLQNAAWAQPVNTPAQPGPTVRRITRLYATRVTAIEQSCQIDLHEVLDRQLRSTNATLTSQLDVLNSTTPASGQTPNQNRAARIADVAAGAALARAYLERLAKGCNPFNLYEQVQEAKRACNTADANRLLRKMRTLSDLFKRRYEVARALGNSSSINVEDARGAYETSVRLYEGANNYTPSNCETPNGGGIDTGGETIELPDISGGPEDQYPAEEMLQQWEWIAGNWDIADFGGQIEFRVESDGTLSAYIASTNQRMIDHGYAEGVQILRGYQLVGVDGLTWRFWANGGEVFSARYPERGPGDVWGEEEWIEGGVIYLPNDSASVSFPALLADRLANFTNPLVRPDTTALDNIIAEYNQRTAELEAEGTHQERMALVQSAIEALDSQSANSTDAGRAAQMLALLSERDELRDNPQLSSALDTLEQGADPADEAAAWQTLVAHMAASGANLAQPIRGNDYDERAAAQMFRVVRYASTLQDDLRNARGAFSNSNMSRTTAALARLQGIASLAGNASNPTAGQLMDGIRNITTPASGAPGIASGFEFQSAAVAGILEQTIAGVSATADALGDVGAAIGGDRAARGRAIAASRRVESILSVPGYGASVLRSVGNRVIERVPFARTMANWFR